MVVPVFRRRVPSEVIGIIVRKEWRYTRETYNPEGYDRGQI
jgi:hypothetical protein